MKKLKNKIKKLNQDKEFVSFLNREDDIEFHMNTMKYEGQLEGINEGKNVIKMEIAKKMLTRGDDIKDIVELTGLSKEEVKKLK